ncbi:hypothetical protein SANTM175S_00785 [Streptomyces antimycoticus]
MTRVPERASRSRCAYSRYATRCSPTAVLPVPGAPWTQMVPPIPWRTISSCSGWIVATMSRIGPTRGRSISDWSSLLVCEPPAEPENVPVVGSESRSSSYAVNSPPV